MIKVTRRAVATAAAVLALGAASVTWAATSASAAPTQVATRAGTSVTAIIPRCTAGDLAVWVNADSADGAAGTIYYHLDFTNISGATCHLYSWPGVTARNKAGKQLGVPAVRTSAIPATYVNIPPDGTAHSVLGYVDVQVSKSCKPVTATSVKVFPPDDAGAQWAYFPVSACTTKTPYLTISRVLAGA
jgi:hypothetical protein